MQDVDVSVSVEQQSADERLVERILKLFYWPAKMSLVPPAQQEVLFAGEGAERAHASIAADNPFDSAQLVHNIRAQQAGHYFLQNIEVSSPPPGPLP